MNGPPAPPRARQLLAGFINERATKTRDEVGFGWQESATAPGTYQQLRGAYARSQSTGEPLPVSNQFCDATVYGSPTTNIELRFWHDCSHVRLGLSFTPEDELELALWHMAQLEAAGHAPGSVAYELLQADLVGQLLLMALVRRFPIDQAAFVQACVRQGMFVALIDEIRLVP